MLQHLALTNMWKIYSSPHSGQHVWPSCLHWSDLIEGHLEMSLLQTSVSEDLTLNLIEYDSAALHIPHALLKESDGKISFSYRALLTNVNRACHLPTDK